MTWHEHGGHRFIVNVVQSFEGREGQRELHVCNNEGR